MASGTDSDNFKDLFFHVNTVNNAEALDPVASQSFEIVFEGLAAIRVFTNRLKTGSYERFYVWVKISQQVSDIFWNQKAEFLFRGDYHSGSSSSRV